MSRDPTGGITFGLNFGIISWRSMFEANSNKMTSSARVARAPLGNLTNTPTKGAGGGKPSHGLLSAARTPAQQLIFHRRCPGLFSVAADRTQPRPVDDMLMSGASGVSGMSSTFSDISSPSEDAGQRRTRTLPPSLGTTRGTEAMQGNDRGLTATYAPPVSRMTADPRDQYPTP
jgi:hypothetical protein